MYAKFFSKCFSDFIYAAGREISTKIISNEANGIIIDLANKLIALAAANRKDRLSLLWNRE